MKAVDELRRLEETLSLGSVPLAAREWGGADVCIRRQAPPPSNGRAFYPDPRYVITAHSRELSWMFERLRDAFYAESRLDGCSKVEFFGRLANAADRCLRRKADASAVLLCAAVLHEAFAMFDEIEEGNFECFAVAVGNEIADDYVDETLRPGFSSVEGTVAFFASHGVELSGE